MPVASRKSVAAAESIRRMKKGFTVGHLPHVFALFFYFQMSFMVRVVLGSLCFQIAPDPALSSAQKGLMVAAPVLSSAILRVVDMVDRLRPKLTGIILFGLLCAAALIALTGNKSRWRCGWGASAKLGAARI